MEQWDQDYIDLVAPGHLTLKSDGAGLLLFGAVEVELDCRLESVNEIERLDFSFEGSDEGDPVCGRGWAQVLGKCMNGKIYFHMGDDSSFTAVRK
jgi:hypothetical protein